MPPSDELVLTLHYRNCLAFPSAHMFQPIHAIWLLSRRDRQSLGYRDVVLLDASMIHLRVLAPFSCYRGQSLSLLAEGIDAGVKKLGAGQGGARLTFEFQEFSDALLRQNGYSNEEAVAVTEVRRVLKRDV